jgi:glycosyltransferase involved in cell wall biosynthesis
MKRILEIVYQMVPDGTETWLMHVLRRIDRERFHLDFLVHSAEVWPYDEEIARLGGTVFRAPHPSRAWAYDRYVRRVLREHGPYDAVHSHSPYFGAHVLRIAAKEGVPIRIMHSHNSRLPEVHGFLRQLYVRVTMPWIGKYATHGFAVSEMAGPPMFGARWRDDPRWKVLFCGLDFSPFAATFDRREVRRELSLPDDARVVGHVGRFDPQKNHPFIVEVAKSLARGDPRNYFVLVGDGGGRGDAEHSVAAAGLRERFRFLGRRDDIPRLMLSAMDVFFFPSLFEGLGLVLVEAQAAGLACICSDAIPREADVIPALVTRRSLDAPVESWAQAIQERLDQPRPMEQSAALANMLASPFSIEKNLGVLERLYSGESACNDQAGRCARQTRQSERGCR